MILHFVTDEKFIDMAHREFEAVAPGCNRFLMLSRPCELKFIKNTPIEFISRRRCEHLLTHGRFHGVCLHNIYSGSAVLRFIPAGKKVVWFGWGFDYYNGPLSSPDMSENLLLPQTKALMASLPPEPKLVLRAIVRKVLDRVWRGGAVISNEGLSRIDYFSPVLDTEFEMLKERNPWFSAQYVIWNYGTVEDDFVRGSGCVNSIGSDLLVGNSSSASNNHLELFDWLRGRSDLGGRKVFAPLSYGSESYKNAIVAAGLERLNDRFVPLTDFQPVDQYLKTVSRCGFVFMNHLRQQAVGNVVIALVSGAKLFLNPRNPLYGWLQARGAVVFDIGSLDNSHPDSAQVFNPVCEHDILRNREVAISHWGREAQREKTRMIVDLLKQ